MIQARRVVRLKQVASTNDLAKQFVLDATATRELPMVIRADRQTKGRGRGSNTWWSDEGSLTFSVLLDPVALGLQDRHTPLCSLATAVAVVDAVRPWVARGTIALRWPNDVEIDGRKIAGILPERVNGPEGPRLVIGIGLNVRSRLDEAPEDVRRMAASIAEYADREPSGDDMENLLTALLDRLGIALDALARDDPVLPQRWAALDQLLDHPVRIDLGGEILAGVGRGIGPDGGLRIDDGRLHRTIYGGRVLREG